VTLAPMDALLANRFQVEREVGRGGVGIVYKALDVMTGEAVALKVIAIAGVDAGEEARFQREGRVLSGLSHASIVRVVDFGQLDQGQPYVAMEWLEGEDVQQRLRRAPLTLSQCLDIAAMMAEALASAHRAGVIHRDVKPSNIFLVGSSRENPLDARFVAKLVDFGVAAAEDAKLTRTGAIVGTPAYMAPEQARGDGEVRTSVDLYALGATLFEMIAGRPPHVGPTPIAILARLVTTPAPRLSEVVVDVPPALDDLMASLLATAPEERPADADTVAIELRSIAREVEVSTGRLRRSTLSDPPASVSSGTYSVNGTPSGRSGGTRLVTSILATQVPKGPARAELLEHLRANGAEATELGGDAIVAHLGATKALGDEAMRALDLATRLAQARAGVGVATGRTRIDRTTRATGEVVDRAAALSRDAQRGQVLVDTTTTELARGRYEFLIRGDGSAIVGEAMQNKRDVVSGAPFTGREAELAQVMGAYDRAVEDSTPIVVSVLAAPGMGKTRLRREAISRVGSHSSSPRIILVRCEPFAKSHALGVVADIARDLLRVAKGGSLEDARAAVDVFGIAHDAPLSPTGRELVARLVANESLAEANDPQGARDAVWIALTDIAVAATKSAPLVLTIEDGQWADDESMVWVDHLLARAGGRPLCVLALLRPSPREGRGWFEGRDHVQVELRPLSKKTVRAIARAMLGERALGESGEHVAELIAAQAGGSPLFAEELARLAASGRDATSAPTIEAAIQVNLDALDDQTRAAASLLAVCGQRGWDAGLTALGVSNASDTLRALGTSELIVEQASSRFKDTREWAFKHALIREVAYAALGEASMREAHARAGRWLAKMGEDDATVARHLELGRESTLAASYLEKAARRALAAHALADAVSLAERALAFAEDKPTQFTRAQLLDEAWIRQDARAGERDSAVRAMAEAVHDTASEVRASGARVRYEDACGGDAGTSARLNEVLQQAQAAGLVDEEARCAAALAARYAFAGDLEHAQEVADGLLALSQKHANAGGTVDAWQTLAVVHQARGEVGAALDARRAAVRAANEAGLKAREATLTINMGFALTTLGARTEARDAIMRGVAIAQAVGSPGTVRHGQMNLLCWTSTFGADAQLDTLLAEPRATADAAISGSWVAQDRATLGVLFYRGVELLLGDARGQAESARILLKAASQGYRATNMLDVLPVALGRLAEAERRCGDPEKAYALAREAADLLDHGSPSLLNEAPVFLALHDAAVARDCEDEAKLAIARAIPRLVTRVRSLVGTPYARAFLTQLTINAGLLSAAEEYGLVPAEITAILERGAA
jgi:serine/threonine protein kinase/tetratricopeptide (TPR) repeat protein